MKLIGFGRTDNPQVIMDRLTGRCQNRNSGCESHARRTEAAPSDHCVIPSSSPAGEVCALLSKNNCNNESGGREGMKIGELWGIGGGKIKAFCKGQEYEHILCFFVAPKPWPSALSLGMNLTCSLSNWCK